MSLTITTTNAAALLKKLRDYIDQGKSRTWKYKANRFSEPDTDRKGELEASIVGNDLVLLVKHPGGLSRSDALLLESRFARFVLDHGHALADRASISGRKQPGDDIQAEAHRLKSFGEFL